MLLAGEMEPFPTLRAQLPSVRVAEREDFGGGYNLKLAVDFAAPRTVIARFDFHDVEMVTADRTMGCTLTVERGALSTFEYDRYERLTGHHPDILRLSYSALLVAKDEEGEMIDSELILLQERDWEEASAEIVEYEGIHHEWVAGGRMRFWGEYEEG